MRLEDTLFFRKVVKITLLDKQQPYYLQYR